MTTSFQQAKDARLAETGRHSFAPVDESIFFNQGSGARQPVWRLNGHGDKVRVLPEEDDPKRLDRKIVPPTGDYTMVLIGMGEPASERNNFHDPNDERSQAFVLKAWMEFEILDGPHAGKWFSNKWTWPRALRKPKQGNVATMADFAIRLLGDEPDDDFDRRDLLGIPFRSRVKNRSERYSALATDEVEPLNAGSAQQMITLDQAGLVDRLSHQLWKTRGRAKQKLFFLLDSEFGVETKDKLTYDQADQLINWLDTDPQAIKELVEKLEEQDETGEGD